MSRGFLLVNLADERTNAKPLPAQPGVEGMTLGLTESAVEDAVLAWLESPGYAVLHGPDFARASWGRIG